MPTSPPAPSPGTPGSADEPSAGDRQRATASLARALERQGVMTAEQAGCTAARWIEEAGLDEMREAGFFDREWSYVDQDRSAMTRPIEAAASAAAHACATPGG